MSLLAGVLGGLALFATGDVVRVAFEQRDLLDDLSETPCRLLRPRGHGRLRSSVALEGSFRLH